MSDLRSSTAGNSGEFIILGVTTGGATFRPGDWAERLSGAMACFRLASGSAGNRHHGFSPYVRPAICNGVKAVIVSGALRSAEPLGYHFVVGFAQDNDLQIVGMEAEPGMAGPPRQ